MKNLTEWLQEGDALYNENLAEYQRLEAELLALAQRRAEKWAELDAIAKLVGRRAPDAPGASAAPQRSNAVATTLGGKR